MSAPLVVGAVCGRPGCGHGEDLHDGICFGMACECVRFVVSAGGLPMPVPVVPEPRTLDVVEHELTGARLSLYEEELETARLRLALKSAQRGRSRLRARVAELEAERHSTNAVPSPSFAERADRETDLGRRAAYRMLAEPEPEFHAYLHHPYQREHDMPETGGAL